MSRVQSRGGPDLRWQAVFVCGGTGCSGQRQHLPGKFPFHTIEQWGKLKIDRSAELHICFARRYRLSFANRLFSTLGAPREASTHGQAPEHEASAGPGQGKNHPLPDLPTRPQTGQGEKSEAGSSSARERQAVSGKKKDCSACTGKLQQEQRLAGARPDRLQCSTTACHPPTKGSGETPPSQESLEGHGDREWVGWRGPSLALRAAGLCGQPDPSSLPQTRRSASAAVPRQANPAQHQHRAVPRAHKKRHR